MKISINDEDLLTLTEIQKKVIQNDVIMEEFEDDMKRRLHYIIHHPANRFVEQNSKSARDFLKTRNVSSVPADKMEFAALVFEYAPVPLSQEEMEKYIIKVDGKDCFEITETTKKLLKSCVAKDCCCIEWSKERLKWILMHKYQRCMERLRRSWEPKLMASGYKELPLDDDKFAELVFSQPNYKNRSQREAEASRCPSRGLERQVPRA